MRLFSMLLASQRKLRASEWRHCYIAIRSKLEDEVLKKLEEKEVLISMANIEYLQELFDLLVIIEKALDIRNIADLDRYEFRHYDQIIRLSDSMWNIIRSVIPLGGEEEELEEEDIDGE